MGRIIIRLTESELRGLIREAVAGVLQQPKELSTDAISRLIYDTTGINVNESRVKGSITEDRKDDRVPKPDSVRKSIETDKAKEAKPTDKKELEKAIELANSRVDDATKAKEKAKEGNKEEESKPGEKVPRSTLLKHILIDYYDGIEPAKIARKYKVPKAKIGDLIKAALRKFNGDDEFKKMNPKKGETKAKLAKPSNTFRNGVMKIARKRIEDKIGKKETDSILGPESGSRTGFEAQLRRKGGEKTTPVGSGEEMNTVQPEPSYIDSPEFKIEFEDAITKYLGGNMDLKEMLLHFYSGRTFKDIGRMFKIDEETAARRIRNAVETLRNSVGFKREVSSLLNGKYDEKKVRSLGMTGYVMPTNKEMFTSMREDYRELVNVAYMRINGLNTNQNVGVPDDVGCTMQDFVKYMTNNLVFDYHRRRPQDRKRIDSYLQNIYQSSAFYNKWKSRIENETDN